MEESTTYKINKRNELFSLNLLKRKTEMNHKDINLEECFLLDIGVSSFLNWDLNEKQEAQKKTTYRRVQTTTTNTC